MRAFDHDFVNELMTKLGRLKPDSKPRWGGMTSGQLITHLVTTVRYSMGQGGDIPFAGNWFTVHVIGPLVIHGLVPIPKNVKAPAGLLQPSEPIQTDLETLHAVLERYLNLVQSGELTPKPHPIFGDIGIDGWAKMHVRHFNHHLKQFGL